MAPAEQPIGVAIVVCDSVITDASTQNRTLVNIFNTINASNFPCVHDRMALYVALTNGQGRKKIKIQLKQLNNAQVSGGLSAEIEFGNPNAVAELIFILKRVVFVNPGIYAFEVFADEEYIFESRFNVTRTEAQQ